MFKWNSSSKPVLRGIQLCLLAVLAGCGPDGNQANDNTLTGPVKGVSSDTGTVTAAAVTVIGATRELAGSSAGDVEAYEAVVLSTNTVMVVWKQSNGTQSNLFARTYSGGTWSATELLESGSGSVGSFKVLRDSNDTVTVIWTQASALGGDIDNLFTARNDGAWSAQQAIDSSTGVIGAFEAIVDSSNNITVVWGQNAGTGTDADIYSRRGDGNGNWGAVSAALNDTAQGSAYYPQLVVDGTGDVTAIWRQDVSGRYDVYARRYAGAWGGLELLSNGAGGSVDNETLVVDSAGNVTVAWKQFDGAQYFNLFYERYSGAWLGAPAQLNVATRSASAPRLVLGAANKIFVFWTEDNGASANDLKARELTGAVQVTIDNQATNPGLEDVAVDGSGNLTVIWSQNQGAGTKNDLWARRYLNATGWQAVGNIQQLSASSPAGDATSARAHADTAGNVTVYWLQDADTAGVVDLWANRYVTATATWLSSPVSLEDLSDSATSPSSLMESAATGKVDLLWQQADSTGSDHLLVNHHNGSTGWSGVRRVDGGYVRSNGDSVDPSSGQSVNMYVDSAAVVTVFWLQQINETDTNGQEVAKLYLLANRFSSASW